MASEHDLNDRWPPAGDAALSTVYCTPGHLMQQSADTRLHSQSLSLIKMLLPMTAVNRQVQQALAVSPAQLDIKHQRQQQQQLPAAAKSTSMQQLQQQLSKVCELLHLQDNDLRHGVR